LNNPKKITTAIILAGGLGTRLREIVSDLPKPMVPIRDRPFLEYQMDYWINQGISHFILSVGYLKDIIIDHFGNMYKNIPIEYAIEPDPLGTGGGLLMAAKGLKTPFLVLNGDTFIEVDLNNLYEFHLKCKSMWTFSLFRTGKFERYMGMDVSPNGEILSLKSELNKSISLANGGVYLIDPLALKLLDFKVGDRASLEDELLSNFISNGGVLHGKEFKGKFIDIGTPEDYHQAIDILPN
jgi:D-glycero-alpha-D-manno-heptose 1-phosphate guanylyltransferase